jgi:hypothetical protein
VRQAVGIFANKAGARKAFEALNSKKRQRCIASAISFVSHATLALQTQDLKLGDDAELMRFRVQRSQVKQPSYIDAVSVRVGRATTALLLLSQAGAVPGQLEQRLVREASARLVNGFSSAG